MHLYTLIAVLAEASIYVMIYGTYDLFCICCMAHQIYFFNFLKSLTFCYAIASGVHLYTMFEVRRSVQLDLRNIIWYMCFFYQNRRNIRQNRPNICNNIWFV